MQTIPALPPHPTAEEFFRYGHAQGYLIQDSSTQVAVYRALHPYPEGLGRMALSAIVRGPARLRDDAVAELIKNKVVIALRKQNDRGPATTTYKLIADAQTPVESRARDETLFDKACMTLSNTPIPESTIRKAVGATSSLEWRRLVDALIVIGVTITKAGDGYAYHIEPCEHIPE